MLNERLENTDSQLYACSGSREADILIKNNMQTI
jgi:hypothetical protein